jgi:hypothetical protein
MTLIPHYFERRRRAQPRPWSRHPPSPTTDFPANECATDRTGTPI